MPGESVGPVGMGPSPQQVQMDPGPAVQAQLGTPEVPKEKNLQCHRHGLKRHSQDDGVTAANSSGHNSTESFLAPQASQR